MLIISARDNENNRRKRKTTKTKTERNKVKVCELNDFVVRFSNQRVNFFNFYIRFRVSFINYLKKESYSSQSMLRWNIDV